jgi:tetratricopeptide (TPR) repeat protein
MLSWFATSAIAAEGTAEETNAFEAASKMFIDMQYRLAETNFINFLNNYSNSTHRADAILYVARAELEQSHPDKAVAQLEKSFPEAGALGPEYAFWIAKAHFSQGEYTNAAAGFANVARMGGFPRRLEAAYNEAFTYAAITNWNEVIRVLQKTNGVFYAVSALEPKNPFASLGKLLLGEALLETHQFAEADKTVRALDTVGMDPDVAWRRQYLLCQIDLEAGRDEPALVGSTNLLTLATGPTRRAASEFLQGQILESLGRTNEALQAYSANLVPGLPSMEQQRAMAKTVQLTVAISPPDVAIDSLTNLIGRLPQSPGIDLARVVLGELYLKAFAASTQINSATNAAPPPGNSLENALTNFNIVINNFTNSAWLPKARLDRGWCYWSAGKITQAGPDFAAAANGLPYSADQAVARFKLGDVEFASSNYTGALSNYNEVLQRYDGFPTVTNELYPQALYQIVEAEINLGNDKGAEGAAKTILRWFPNNYLGERSSMLMGEKLLLVGRKMTSRQAFIDLVNRSPNSLLAPEARYDIARSFDDEGDWKEAIHYYDEWLGKHHGDSLQPQVEYYRALAYSKVGMGTNALNEFTNFVARYPSNSLVPWAQIWVADYYYNQQAYPQAELRYQELAQNPKAGALAYKALFSAGKTALANQEIPDARNYFSKLINDTNTPTPLAAQAFFALGDVLFQQFQRDPTNGIYLSQAITALSKLTNGAPTNTGSVEALGRLGDYYAYYAEKRSDATIYANAVQMYSAVLSFPPDLVSVAARAQAEVGLGIIAEREHKPEQALEHYARVLYTDPDHFDPYWVETAGEYMAQVCEAEQQWDQAVKAYYRVLEAIPSLAPVLEKRIAAARGHADVERN